jgi:hypothetical protein
LHVNLDFQLGAGDGDFKAVSAHLPETLEWLGEEEEGRKKVRFYPLPSCSKRGAKARSSAGCPPGTSRAKKPATPSPPSAAIILGSRA